MNLKRKIESKFGTQCFSHALFYHYQYSLRLELSPPSGHNHLRQFLIAFEKASNVFNTVLKDGQKGAICLSFYGESRTIRNLSNFRNIIYDNEIIIPKDSRCYWYEHDSKEDLTRCFILFEAPLSRNLIDKLLWGSLAKDLGIKPSLYGIHSYIYSYEKNIILHPYDDRGMDIAGINQISMQKYYNAFHNYLLNYDMDKMQQAFER